MLLVALMMSGVLLVQPPAKEPRACTRLREVAADTTVEVTPGVPSLLKPRSRGGPSYPKGLRGTPGEVRMVFVLDTLGRAIRESIGILSQTDPEFGRSVCEYVTHATFEPVVVGGKRLTTRFVGQKFSFATGR